MKHFFSVYKALEGKQAVAKDVNDRAAAVQVTGRPWTTMPSAF